MAFPFKIPKKKQQLGSDSPDLKMQSPLSCLECLVPQSKDDSDPTSKGGKHRMHTGNTLDSTKEKLSTPHKPLFRDVVKTVLGLNSSNTDGSPTGRLIQQDPRSSSVWLSKGFCPKRASDRLLQSESASVGLSPPQKKKSDLNGSSLLSTTICVQSVDCLSELRGVKHVVSSEFSLKPQKSNMYLSSLDPTLEDNSVFLSKERKQGTRLYHKQAEDVREKERQRGNEFREKMPNRLAILRLQLKKKPTHTETEPIVLSSEEEEEGEDTRDGTDGTSQNSSSCLDNSCLGNSEKIHAEESVDKPTSFLQLKFTSLHVGLVHVDGNGKILITESGITIPLKGVDNGEVTVVASQLRGYGVWDGGVAQGGSLLAAGESQVPSLLFLWVSDAQANLLHKELITIQTPTSASGDPCSCLLLVLKEQLQELQTALLASILDMEEYKKGHQLSTGLNSPLDWTDGLLLFHSCPSPIDQHLLKLLGHSSESKLVRSSQSDPCSSHSQKHFSRLIQYPAAPCKGRITVTKEDLACLNSGEFLNDVIIDFYLKYLLLEGVKSSVVERSHVFSSFFYKQLSRRRAAAEHDIPSVPDCYMRHQRVKTWTRHVDIFTKDFLFVPVNQEAHWYLVVVCFPGLEKIQYEKFQKPPGGAEQVAGKTSTFSLRSLQSPDCTQQGCHRNTVLKRPCILIMDSLKKSYHENVCRLLRDYLQVEWQVRKGTRCLLTADNMKISNCKVPLQDNSSDCGLYLLQYVESFLQNPVVHFDFPLRLDNWFPRQHVRQKREEIRNLIMRMNQSQECDKELTMKQLSH